MGTSSQASPVLLLALLLLGCSARLGHSRKGKDEVHVSLSQRLHLHRPAKVVGSVHPGDRDWAETATGLGPDQSGCSCYRIRNGFCCWQALCVCHNVCYNGTAILGNFRRVPCVLAGKPLPWAASPYGRREAPLKPVPCRKTDRFWHHLGIALKEGPIPDGSAHRSPSWRRTRQAITWRDGTTYLQILDEPTVGIAHFWGKVAQMLLINNASAVAPGLPYFVDRFMLPRNDALQESMASKGAASWHANILAVLLKLATDPLSASRFSIDQADKELLPERLVAGHSLLGGVVEFERNFNGASEDRPLCFDRVVLPGYLKANFFPGGPAEGLWFKERVWQSVGVVPPALPKGSNPKARARDPVRALYIARRGDRRTFFPDSEASLLALLETMDLEVQQIDFSTISFQKQVEMIVNAEIIVGLHGAALTNAALAMSRAVLFEIFPYRVFHYGYYFSSINSGVSYFMHQCRQGDPQARDAEFSSLSLRSCLNSPQCKQYFTHERQVELTQDDLLDIAGLLEQAKQFVVEARWNLKWAGARLLKRYDVLCTSRQRDIRCRLDLIRSPVADINTECVVKKDCQGVILRDDDSREEIL